MTSLCLHASCVSVNGQGVLLVGPSGIGKTDVALRLIDGGGQLVADDQTQLDLVEGQLVASSPATLAGLIEVRHVGLLTLPFRAQAPVALYVELVAAVAGLERLPQLAFYSLLDCPVRWLKLPATAASTPAKINMVLQGSFYEEA